ncbi:hypothetical protein ACFFRR_006936 [Megaselia abdita]
MGICLDTDSNIDKTIDEPSSDVEGFNSKGQFMQQFKETIGKIKFDPPKVPVIFVIGGPGSGKVTHCDTFMHEKKGIIHINMMDLLQQYAIGNDLQDFSQLPSKTVTEVLMLEMKMAPAAKAYLISGYPRSMRDVVEYSEKIQVINGIILISWRKSVLQKQIDYGAKLGHVVLSLAKMELDNFFKNVMPVADYFDQSDLLIAVNGERSPVEVFKDFRKAVIDILKSMENEEAVLNGVSGIGRGANDIPGQIVSVDTAESARNRARTITADNSDFRAPTKYPSVIFVVGGPGSNKAELCEDVLKNNSSCGHISIGTMLRSITSKAPRANTESYAIKESLSNGDLVSETTIRNMLDTEMEKLKDKSGIIIDGYPRNKEQAKYFEDKYKQQPFVILLDCSKLQLGKGRIDDSVSAFRRRLELFREITLPLLKNLDKENKLMIIDGDTDSPSVRSTFEKAVNKQLAEVSKGKGEGLHHYVSNNSTITKLQNNTDAVLHDLEPSRVTNSNFANNVNKDVKLKNILSEAEKFTFES